MSILLPSSRPSNAEDVFLHSAPHVDLWFVTHVFHNFIRVIILPYTATVPVDCSTHMKLSVIRKPNSVEAGLVLFNAEKNICIELLSRTPIGSCHLLDQLKPATAQR
jgi:hypothetical protein